MEDARISVDAVFTFGPYRLDLAERTLLCDGEPVPLRAKLFDTLVYLVARAGRLVERQELIDAIWPESIVEEGNLSHNVSALRKALGDGDEYIQTVPKRGYRFVHALQGAGVERAGDDLSRARQALAQGAYDEAHRRFRGAAASGPLSGADLIGCAEAARWSGSHDEVVPLLEGAIEVFRRDGELVAAAGAALDLATVLLDRGRPALARGHLRQAERGLEQVPTAARERARLARLQARLLWLQGAWAGSLELAQQAVALARSCGDRDTEALALVDGGHAQIVLQRFDAAVEQLEQAGAAAAAGGMGPYAAGLTMCGLITGWRACGRVDRASEWVEASIRWVDGEGVAHFPGICRVHRGELACLRGDLAEAEADLRRGCEELAAADSVLAGMGLRELGLVRLRRGDLDGAEQAFGRALDYGFDPQPGLALLRAARGEPELARRDLERFLADAGDGPHNILDREHRYAVLGALVSLARSTGEPAVAQRAVAELEQIAAAGAPVHRAVAEAAAGELALARGDVQQAVVRLRRGLREWIAVNAPFEAATVRVALAEALQRDGDAGRARMEIEGAAATFLRLGARLDHQRALQRLGGLAVDGSADPVVACAEIVGAAGLRAAIGAAAYADLAAWLQRRLLACWQRHGGRPLPTEDGVFAVEFADLDSCLRCAGYVRRSLQEQRLTHGFAPALRLGLVRASCLAGERGSGAAGGRARRRWRDRHGGRGPGCGPSQDRGTGDWPHRRSPRRRRARWDGARSRPGLGGLTTTATHETQPLPSRRRPTMQPLTSLAFLSACAAALPAQDFIHYKFDSTCTNEVINYATSPQALASNGTPGCYLRIVRSHFKGRRYLFRWPLRRAMNSVRDKIRAITDRRRCARVKDVREIMRELDPVLRGWGNYFRTGNATARLNQFDRYVRMRLCRVLSRRGGQRRPNFLLADWLHTRFVEEHGLHKLLGTIRYPGGPRAASVRRARVVAWRTWRRTWWTLCCRTCRTGSGCCRCRSSQGGCARMTRVCAQRFVG